MVTVNLSQATKVKQFIMIQMMHNKHVNVAKCNLGKMKIEPMVVAGFSH